jgi:hypothetical protein
VPSESCTEGTAFFCLPLPPCAGQDLFPGPAHLRIFSAVSVLLKKKTLFTPAETVLFPEKSDFSSCPENIFFRQKNSNFFSFSNRCIVAEPKPLSYYSP